MPKRTKPGRTARTEYRWEKRTFSSKDLPLSLSQTTLSIEDCTF
jgi:hypothetical protein